VGGAEQEERRGARLALDEVGVGLVPRVLDGERVDDLDLGRLAVDQKLDIRSSRGEVLVAGDVFPEEPEILGREGMAVGPFVTGAQLERELAAVLLLVALEDVGLQLELVVVDDEARVAEDGHQAGIARTGHQHVELAALLAGTLAAREMPHDPGLLGDAPVDRRQGAGLHLVGEHRRFLEGGHGIGSEDRPRHPAEDQCCRQNASLHLWSFTRLPAVPPGSCPRAIKSSRRATVNARRRL
jgi:hypothetical protein